MNNFITPWSKQSSRDFDSWHSMCSYLGAFPPSLANYFIRYFTKEGGNVMDPFSGRGTTLLEGRLLGRNVIASDLNPIALALSEAKSSNLNIKDVFLRIDELEKKYDPSLYQPEAHAQPQEILLIFHPKTLAQLCYLQRKILNKKNRIDDFLVGLTLGILHGGERADGSSGYASIDMPNTYSMSPEYVRKFVQVNQLNRIHRNVFDLLRDKANRVFKKHNPSKTKGYVRKVDAKKLASNVFFKKYHSQIDLLLTSPPYLGIVNYAKQNWIRLWFLGVDTNEIHDELDDDLSLHEWLEFSKDVLCQIKPFMKKTGVAVFVIGDVAKSKTSIIPLAREFCFMVRESGLFKNIWCISDIIESTDKTTRIWAETKGNATAIDRIVFLSDVNPFKKVYDKSLEALDYEFILSSTKDFI